MSNDEEEMNRPWPLSKASQNMPGGAEENHVEAMSEQRISNQVRPEHEAKMLTAQPRRSVPSACINSFSKDVRRVYTTTLVV